MYPIDRRKVAVHIYSFLSSLRFEGVYAWCNDFGLHGYNIKERTFFSKSKSKLGRESSYDTFRKTKIKNNIAQTFSNCQRSAEI